MRLFLVKIGIVVMLIMMALSVAFAAGEGEVSGANTAYTENPWTDGDDLSGTTVNAFGAFIDVDEERFGMTVKVFEEQTGIDVVYEGSEDFESLITSRVEGDSPPDVVAFAQQLDLLDDVVRGGGVIDVNDWFSTAYLKQQYIDSWLEMATMENIMAGIWHRAAIGSLVWYPKPAFDAAGYKVPETWDELIALSDQIVADGGVPWAIGIDSPAPGNWGAGWVATDWIEDILLRTAPASDYDAWVRGELPFDSPQIRNAIRIMSDIWFKDGYVLGGKDGILHTSFGGSPRALFEDPPAAWLHRQAAFAPAFFPEGTQTGVDVDFFYLPPIDPKYGKPVFGAGDIYAFFNDRPEVRAFAKFLTTGLSTKAWVEQGGFISPHKDAELSWYPNEVDRKYAEILSNATTFRYDGSVLMPAAVGGGTFRIGMVDYVNGKPLDNVLRDIDNSWPR